MSRHAALFRHAPLVFSSLLLGVGVCIYLSVPHIDDLYNVLNNNGRPRKPEGTGIYLLLMPTLLLAYSLSIVIRQRPEVGFEQNMSTDRARFVAVAAYLILAAVTIYRYHAVLRFYAG